VWLLELVCLQGLPKIKFQKNVMYTNSSIGPAHAVYFATYEAVKHVMGGNQAGVHHPLAAGKLY
jgi:hypothetical protein